jgi:hypothetical protein
MKIGEVRQVAVMVHGAEGGGFPVAIAVRGLHTDRAALRALGSIDAAWPEHYAWELRALDRGDVWAASDGTVWFFEGEEGEALAGL